MIRHYSGLLLFGRFFDRGKTLWIESLRKASSEEQIPRLLKTHYSWAEPALPNYR